MKLFIRFNFCQFFLYILLILVCGNFFLFNVQATQTFKGNCFDDVPLDVYILQGYKRGLGMDGSLYTAKISKFVSDALTFTTNSVVALGTFGNKPIDEPSACFTHLLDFTEDRTSLQAALRSLWSFEFPDTFNSRDAFAAAVSAVRHKSHGWRNILETGHPVMSLLILITGTTPFFSDRRTDSAIRPFNQNRVLLFPPVNKYDNLDEPYNCRESGFVTWNLFQEAMQHNDIYIVVLTRNFVKEWNSALKTMGIPGTAVDIDLYEMDFYDAFNNLKMEYCDAYTMFNQKTFLTPFVPLRSNYTNPIDEIAIELSVRRAIEKSIVHPSKKPKYLVYWESGSTANGETPTSDVSTAKVKSNTMFYLSGSAGKSMNVVGSSLNQKIPTGRRPRDAVSEFSSIDSNNLMQNSLSAITAAFNDYRKNASVTVSETRNTLERMHRWLRKGKSKNGELRRLSKQLNKLVQKLEEALPLVKKEFDLMSNYIVGVNQPTENAVLFLDWARYTSRAFAQIHDETEGVIEIAEELVIKPRILVRGQLVPDRRLNESANNVFSLIRMTENFTDWMKDSIPWVNVLSKQHLSPGVGNTSQLNPSGVPVSPGELQVTRIPRLPDVLTQSTNLKDLSGTNSTVASNVTLSTEDQNISSGTTSAKLGDSDSLTTKQHKPSVIRSTVPVHLIPRIIERKRLSGNQSPTSSSTFAISPNQSANAVDSVKLREKSTTGFENSTHSILNSGNNFTSAGGEAATSRISLKFADKIVLLVALASAVPVAALSVVLWTVYYRKKERTSEEYGMNPLDFCVYEDELSDEPDSVLDFAKVITYK